MEEITNSYEEKIDTNDFGMPLRYYYIDSSDPSDLTMFAHWHSEIEIQIFTQGNANITIDNSEVHINENDILIIPSQSIHFGFSSSPHIKNHTLIFHIEALCPQNRENSVQKYFNPFINRTASLPYVIHPSDKGYDDIRFCIDEIIRIVKAKPTCYELMISNRLTGLFIHLYSNNYVSIKVNNTISDKNYLAVRDAIAFIEKNYSKPLTVDELASNAGFSKSRFMSIFKEYTNITCKRYINLYRLESSLQLLKDTDNTVLNIAISSGYNNISLFNREFKKVYGVTPLEYRKANKKNFHTP